MKDILEDIKNNTHQTKELLEKSLELDVRPRNWHDSETLTATTEKRYNVFKNLGKQGGRYLRIKTSKASTIRLGLADVGQAEKFEEGLKANRIGKFRFKAPMLLTNFYITPSAADTVVTFWVSTIEMPVDLEDDLTHLDGDTFESISDRAVLIAGEDGTNIRTIQVDSTGQLKLSEADNNQNFGFGFGGFLPLGQQLGDAFYADASVTASGAGTSWSTAVKTIAELDALMTTQNSDYGFVAQGLYSESASVNGVSITKANCVYVGQDWGATVVSNGNASAVYVFNITATGVGITQFNLAEATNTVETLYCTGNHCYIHHNIFLQAAENHIHLTSNYCVIYWNRIFSATNDGIEISGSAKGNWVIENFVHGAGDNGIHLNGDGVDDNFVYRNEINGDAGTTDYGITVTLGDNNHFDWNSMGEMGTWPVFNSGSNNYWGAHNSADSISGSYNRTVANGTTLIATNVTNIDLWASGKYEFQWDLSTLVTAGEGGNVDGYIYSKVITTYIRRDMDRMVIGTDNLHPTCEKGFVGSDSQLQEGLQCSVAVTANRLVGWRIVKTS